MKRRYSSVAWKIIVTLMIFDVEGYSYCIATEISMAVGLQHNLGAESLIGNVVIALQLEP